MCAMPSAGVSRPIVFIALSKQLAVFGLVDGSALAPIISTPMSSRTPFSQVQRAVQRGLATHGGQQRIGRSFSMILATVATDRLDIGGVGHGRVGHDGGRVGVHQNHPVTLFAQRLTGLGTGVVELAGLADNDRAGAEDQDAFNVCTFWHAVLEPCQRRVSGAWPSASIKWSNSGATSVDRGSLQGAPGS